MNTDELIISVVLAGMVLVIVLSRKLNIAYPILLLLAGLLIGFVPGAPRLEIDPKIILLGALPPLLFYHSFLTSSREIKRTLGAIFTLSIGLVLGRAAAAINSHIEDPATAPVIVLVAAYLAFIPAEAAHLSPVLAAVTAGRVIGARSPVVDRPGTRISGYGFWDAFAFLITAGLFVVMGLQLPVIAAALPTNLGSTLLFQVLSLMT